LPVIHALPTGLWDVRDLVKGTALVPNALQIPGTLGTPNQVIKTAAIAFSPSSGLVLQRLRLPFVAIYANVWYFADNFKVSRASVNLDGKPGHPAIPAPPTGAGYGHNGNNGNNGTAGTDGQDGFSLPRYVFFARGFAVGAPPPGISRPATIADMQAIFSFDGIDGGDGGVGGAGGNGTNGNQGQPGEDGDTILGITNCAGGPGYGGRGGNAGSGGPGGYGGNGGDGANVFIFVQPGLLDLAEAINVSVIGGASGLQGLRGADGQPGHGGPGGTKTGACTADRPGPNGGPGPNCRYPEQLHLPGQSGNVVVAEYDGFDTELN
jgi:hypothetical protein